MKPLVSIIVPNYNHASFLNDRLDSIFNQTFQNFEVILLDDCSTDNSIEILSKYKEHPKVKHCIFNKVNTGNTFIQWNKGLHLAKGEFIWIAESDDVCDNIFLEELLKPLLEDKNMVLSYCESDRLNNFNEVTGSWRDYALSLDNKLFLNNFKYDGNLFIEKFLITKNVIPNASAVVFRKERAIQLGIIDFDDLLKYCGDWLFYIKLITGHKLSYNSSHLNKFRYHTNSVIAKGIKKNNLIFRVDVLSHMRNKIKLFIIKEKPNNYKAIVKSNKKLSRYFKYLKALELLRKRKILTGLRNMIPVFDVFLIEYKFKRSLELKINRFLKK